jgi:DNA polymerase-3 subunit delta'
VDAGTHPDFYPAARPAELHEFPIDLMRELCQRFSLRSARGRGKVILIDGADDLNGPSANCFLKTLEEPPPGSVLILIGTGSDQQLPTVVSRCQVVRFAPLPASVVAEVLRDQGVDDASLRERLVRVSEGSPGVALELADPALWEFRRRLLDELSQNVPDTLTLAREWVALAEGAGKESAAQRGRARRVLRLLTDFLADALTLREGGTPRRVGAEDRAALQAFAERSGTEKLLGLLERCLEADGQVERYAQLTLVLEGLLDALGQQLAA